MSEMPVEDNEIFEPANEEEAGDYPYTEDQPQDDFEEDES